MNSPNSARKNAYLGEKTTSSKIAGPGPTSAGSFGVIFSSKNEAVQEPVIYQKSEPRNLKRNYFLGDFA